MALPTPPSDPLFEWMASTPAVANPSPADVAEGWDPGPIPRNEHNSLYKNYAAWILFAATIAGFTADAWADEVSITLGLAGWSTNYTGPDAPTDRAQVWSGTALQPVIPTAGTSALSSGTSGVITCAGSASVGKLVMPLNTGYGETISTINVRFTRLNVGDGDITVTLYSGNTSGSPTAVDSVSDLGGAAGVGNLTITPSGGLTTSSSTNYWVEIDLVGGAGAGDTISVFRVAANYLTYPTATPSLFAGRRAGSTDLRVQRDTADVAGLSSRQYASAAISLPAASEVTAAVIDVINTSATLGNVYRVIARIEDDGAVCSEMTIEDYTTGSNLALTIDTIGPWRAGSILYIEVEPPTNSGQAHVTLGSLSLTLAIP